VNPFRLLPEKGPKAPSHQGSGAKVNVVILGGNFKNWKLKKPLPLEGVGPIQGEWIGRKGDARARILAVKL